MPCKYYDFVIKNDVNGKLSSVIKHKNVAADDREKSTILAYELNYNQAKVVDYVNNYRRVQAENKSAKDEGTQQEFTPINSIEDLAGLNFNTIVGVLNSYYRTITADTSLQHVARANGDLGFFRNHNIRTFALQYVGHMILDLVDERNLQQNDFTNEEILKEVIKRVRNEYLDRSKKTIDYAIKVLNNTKNKKVEDYNDEEKRCAKGKTSIKKYIGLNEEINKLDKKDKLTDEEKAKLDFLKCERLALRYTITNILGSEKDINYSHLHIELQTNPNEFFKQTIKNNPAAIRIINEFKDLFKDEINLTDLEMNDGDETLNNENNDITGEDGLHDKGWDKSAVQSTFEKLISEDFKLLLYRIPKQKIEYDYEKSQYKQPINDTDNYLGVTTYLDGKLVYNNLIKHCNNLIYFESIDSLINRIEQIAYNVKELNGLVTLVNAMRTKPYLAQLVSSQLRVAHEKKSIMRASSDIFKIVQNNLKFNAVSNDYIRMKDYLHYSYTRVTEDLLQSVPNLSRYNIENVNERLLPACKELFKTLFPVYDTNIIDKYFEVMIRGGNNKSGNLNNEQQIRNFVNNLKSVAEYCINEKKRLNTDYKKNHTVNYDNYVNVDNNSVRINILNIIKTLSEYNASTIPLNSTNAENHTSSNIIFGSWITNLFDLVKSGNREEARKQLKNMFDKTPQFKSNILLNGITDNKGKLIQKGILSDNKNSREDLLNLIDYYLFDGIQNEDTGANVVYDKMNKADFTFTQLLYYLNSISDVTNISDNRNKRTTAYFAKTPSDKPKTFIFIAPKIQQQTSKGLIEKTNNKEVEEQKLRALNDKLVTKFDKNKIKALNKDVNPINDFKEFYDYIVGNTTKVKNVKYTLQKVEENGKALENALFKLSYENNGYKTIVSFKGAINGDEITNIEVVNIYNFKVDKEQFDPFIGDKRVTSKLTFTSSYNKEFKEEFNKELQKDLEENNQIEYNINPTSTQFYGFRQLVIGELRNFVWQLNNVMKYDGDGMIEKDSTLGLPQIALYNPKDGISKVVEYNPKDDNSKIVKKARRFTGRIFGFNTLFSIDGTNYNASEQLIQSLSLYGEAKDDVYFKDLNGKLVFNLEKNGFIKLNTETHQFEFNYTDEVNNIVENVVKTWMNNYKNDILENVIGQYQLLIDSYNENNPEGKINKEDWLNFYFDSALMNFAIDDLMSNDDNFYKDAQTKLKREGQIQGAGIAYSTNLDAQSDSPVEGSLVDLEVTLDGVKQKLSYKYTDKNGNEQIIPVRNGFTAITVKNINRPSDKEVIENLRTQLVRSYDAQGITDEKVKNQLIDYILRGYIEPTKVNDAQSYITIEEFIRRRVLDGTIDKYEPILTKIRNGERLTNDDVSKITSRIQVQKNFYFDKHFDKTTGLLIPRQIKNSEFVLIPELIKGTELEKIYEFMKKNDIDQINTDETSKAITGDIIELWDNETEKVLSPEKLQFQLDYYKLGNDKEGYYSTVIDNYYYRYLYKQQDIVDHIFDKENKAGLQIVKKMFDNISTPALQKYANKFYENYVANIQDSYNEFFDEMGWKIVNGKLVDAKTGNDISPKKLYERFEKEAARLGLNSNFAEYFQLDEFGKPIMPNFLALNSSKQESIVNSLITRVITRQTLPGWHATQVSGVGVLPNGRKLHYHPTVFRSKKNENIDINKETYDKKIEDINKQIDKLNKEIEKNADKLLENSEKVENLREELNNYLTNIATNYSTIEAEYTEIALPRWSINLPDITDDMSDEEVLHKLEEKGLDKMIIYRMPTEGKQSVAIGKVVALTPREYGSTVFVADEWVTQTGSDFDVDSIYGISYNFFVEREKDGAIKKDKNGDWHFIKNSQLKEEDKNGNNRKVRENNILDAFIDVLSHPASVEENLSRSNFEEISRCIDKYKTLSGIQSGTQHTSNPVFQQNSFESAIVGTRIKAISVQNDTFASICNRVKPVLNGEYSISVVYDEDYEIEKNVKAYDINTIKDSFNNVSKTTDGIKVIHDTYGWSKNNRNVVGLLITPYSSQTTAHILDAVKTGAIPNENEFTFGAFKTLINAGVDYDTAIAFLMQPAITEICNNFSASNSAYLRKGNNPILRTLINMLKDKSEGKINDYSTFDKIYKYLKDNYTEFDDIITSKYQLDNTKLEIIQKNLINRFKKDDSQMSSDDKFVHDIITILNFKKLYDIYDRTIEPLIRCSNPDKFGAKQTNHMTNRTLRNIYTYGFDEDNDLIYNFGPRTGTSVTPFLQAIYPGVFNEGEINVMESAYPSLYASLYYSTMPSVLINMNIFDLESDNFITPYTAEPNIKRKVREIREQFREENEIEGNQKLTTAQELQLTQKIHNETKYLYGIIDIVENCLGKRFTETEYIEYKQWLTTYIAYKTNVLINPITLDENNMFIIDEETKNNTTVSGIDYWNYEISRLFGYNTAKRKRTNKKKNNENVTNDITTTFKCINLELATNEERKENLDAFRELSPAEKYVALREYFKDVDLFTSNSLEVQARRIPGKNMTRQIIKFNEDINIETLLAEFNNIIFNKNPYCKLFAADLIKYAFLVEGFKFKYGNISKIVQNDALLVDRKDGGFTIGDYQNFVQILREEFNKIAESKKDLESQGLIDMFVQSHSNMVQSLFIGKKILGFKTTVDRKGNETKTKVTFSDFWNSKEINILKNKIKRIPLTSTDEIINNGLKELLPDTNRFRQYIKITAYEAVPVDGQFDYNGMPITENKKVTRLYKIMYGEDALYLYPISFLEENEFNKYSVNPENNTTYTKEFYESIINIDRKVMTFARKAEDNKVQSLNAFKREVGQQLEQINANETVEELDKERKQRYNATSSLIIGQDGSTPVQLKPIEEAAGIMARNLIISAENENKAAVINDEESSRSVAQQFALNVNLGMIDVTNTNSIVRNKTSIFEHTLRYYKEEAVRIKDLMEHFKFTVKEKVDGEIKDVKYDFAINDDRLFEKLVEISSEYPEYYNQLVDLILYASNFGETIYTLLQLDISDEDERTRNQFETIFNTIKEIRNSKLLQGNNGAIAKFFNIYMAKRFSKNPVIQSEIIALREAYGDISWLDMNIATINDVNNKQVQVMMKHVQNILTRARNIDAPRLVADFQNKFDEIYSKIGETGINKIIDAQGKWIQPYTAEYLDNKVKINQNVADVKAKYGEDSVEYHKAKLNRDIWYAKNVHRPIVTEYYDEINKITKAILDSHPEIYVEYKRLQREINNQRNVISDDELMEDAILKSLVTERDQLTKDVDRFLIQKPENERKAAKALREYITAKRKIDAKYYETIEHDQWVALKDNYVNYIKDYDRRHPGFTLEQKLADNNYREARRWLDRNTITRINPDLFRQIEEMQSIVNESTNAFREGTIDEFKAKIKSAKDRFGRINPQLLDKELIQQYKEELEKIYFEDYDSPYASNSLLRRTPIVSPLSDNFAVYRHEFYEAITNVNGLSKADLARRKKVILAINKLIIDSGATLTEINENNNEDLSYNYDIVKLFENLTEEQLTELSNLYEELNEINEGKTKSKIKAQAFNKLAKITVNKKQADDDKLAIERRFGKNSKEYKTFKNLFYTNKEYINGEYGYKNAPNSNIYGVLEPKTEKLKEKYVDKELTEARKFLAKTVGQIGTEYYYDELRKARQLPKEEYTQWFLENHIYNPYEHTYVPLPIWTKYGIKESAGVANAYEIVPTFENEDKVVKEKYINKNYIVTSANYNSSTGEYNNASFNEIKNDENLNKMYNLLTETSGRYATLSYGATRFNNVYAPREALDDKFTLKKALLQTGKFFGVINPKSIDENWDEIVDYNTDRPLEFSMMSLLKHKDMQKEEEIRKQLPNETDEEYQNYKNKVNETNKLIRERNLALDNAIMNRDWRTVFTNLIYKGEDLLARNNVKNSLYLLIQDIAQNDSYILNPKTKNPILRKKWSNNKDFETFYKDKQSNLLNLLQTVARRIIYEEYKSPSNLNSFGRVLQGYTSSKYMMFNIIGGIANVNTGLVNMLGETFAGDYYSKKSFARAQGEYAKHAIGFLTDIYQNDSSSLIGAIVKRMDIVDYDEVNGERVSKGLNDVTKKLNDLAYSPQSMGEHYMQNVAMLAMLFDCRIYQNELGEYVIGNLSDYNANIEHKVLLDIINEMSDKYEVGNKNLKELYENYLKSIKKDKAVNKDFDNFTRDINLEFIKLVTANGKNNTLYTEFIKRRKEALAKSEEEFNALETFYDQFEWVPVNNSGRGIAQIKKDSKLNLNNNGEFNTNLGDEKLANFINRARSVNQKIHGVYDKLGRARIENFWWGTLLMQYHKHLYPGIMKRWRGVIGDSYYNEQRESIEKGSYVSLFNLLTADVAGFKWKHKYQMNENGEMCDTELTAIESIQELMKGLITSITHIVYNYKLMPLWEQRNVNRAITDLASCLGIALLIMAIYGFTDDDELKESNLQAGVLYTACRMFSEAWMYTPTGLFTEAETLFSQPVAGMGTISDLLKGNEYVLKMMFDEDFEPTYTTGQYKGRNKIEVLFTRNTPIYRIYQNYMNMARRNSYYNGYTSTGSAQKYIKSVADAISD